MFQAIERYVKRKQNKRTIFYLRAPNHLIKHVMVEEV